MLKAVLSRHGMAAVAIAVSLSFAAPSAFAQEAPATALARSVRVLASDPRNFDALISAGHAALEMGDVQAAAGFFGRAEEQRPNDWHAQVGVGAAMVQMGDAAGGLARLQRAGQMGAPLSSYAIDRGMARDLLGDLAGAQADYRAALGTSNEDEARRRLALSLAMSGKGKAAIDAIQPLLNQRDPGAQRSRAFVLALAGDRRGAEKAIEAVMPGASDRFDPFFRLLPTLSVAQKAAAVHLGVFPDQSVQQVAAAGPQPQPVAVQPAPPPSRSKGRGTKPETQQQVASAQNGTPVDGQPRLSGIDKLLATISETEAPPTAQPKADDRAAKAAAARKEREEKAAAAKKLAAKKAAEAKAAAAKKAREEAERLGVPGTYWVQLAGGGNQGYIASEYKKLSSKSRALRKRSGYVTVGKDYFRLVVGPFKTKGQSQAFVNTLAKQGVDAFSWTRSPAQIKIEKLP